MVFQPLPAQDQFTNPSQWKLKLRLRFRTTGLNPNVKYTAYTDAAAATPTYHIQFANLPEAFIQDKVKVLFNGNDVNPANEFEDFIQYMTWVMTTTHA